MAVYERTYRSYEGALTDRKWRFLVLPRYAIEEVFRSKLFLLLPAFCVLYTLGIAIMMYIPHNNRFLEFFGADGMALIEQFIQFGSSFFGGWIFFPFALLSVFVALIVGPSLVTADLRNNGLPLYLARPFNRWDYVMGKISILFALLTAMTVVPGMLLFLFQSYLGGGEWLKEYWQIGLAVPVGFFTWILALCLLCLSISAYVKWKPVARLVLLFVFFFSYPFAAAINFNLNTDWGSVVNIIEMFRLLSRGLLGLPSDSQIPAFAAWISLGAFCFVALGILSRKLRAYEVVR